jgi:hypothetical protein
MEAPAGLVGVAIEQAKGRAKIDDHRDNGLATSRRLTARPRVSR